MRRLTLAVVMALTACAPDLRVDHPFDGNGKCIDPATKKEVDCSLIPLLTIERNGDERSAVVDATNKNSRVFIDLDADKELKTDEAFDTNAWDLSFKRFDIATNGGAGNPTGVVRVAVLKDVSYDTLTKAPADGYQQDGATAIFAAVEGGWYFYDLGIHKLVTREDLLYVVQTSSGAYMKLKMLNYYDSNGTPARMSLKYKPVEAP